ncbi:hypothetical protein IFM89_012825 [Coptis chinensis]|uniref:Uncharacterized protein n=1 Tax=Coptis chinensis TaxID=261450 RepID=A0A835H501_9MAGN|nr:hypothetical protein IFM89_012825 [Coptis chinensis]
MPSSSKRYQPTCNLYYPPIYSNKAYYPTSNMHVKGFYYDCSSCDLVLDILCVSMAPSVKHQSHSHPLKLTYNPPYQTKGLSSVLKPKYGRNVDTSSLPTLGRQGEFPTISLIEDEVDKGIEHCSQSLVGRLDMNKLDLDRIRVLVRVHWKPSGFVQVTPLGRGHVMFSKDNEVALNVEVGIEQAMEILQVSPENVEDDTNLEAIPLENQGGKERDTEETVIVSAADCGNNMVVEEDIASVQAKDLRAIDLPDGTW